MKKIIMSITIIAVSFLATFYSVDKLVAYARSVIFRSGVVLKNNVSISAGSIDQRNGSMTTTTQSFSKALGGVDDYNNNQTMPADSFEENFTQCASANNYCGTNDATTCAGGANTICEQDNRTNLVWSDWLNTGTDVNWFTANNCAQPGSAENPGACAANGNVGCQCVKLTSSKTGCEALGDGNWRLPHQKELMQAYINGSWGNLSHAGGTYWSATTQSYGTRTAWSVDLDGGDTYGSTKTGTDGSRCVR